MARASLLDLTAGARLVCRQAGGEQYRCTAGGYDLSEGMVYTGWAVPLPGAPPAYARVLADARARPRGIWRGTFTHTWPALDSVLKN
jgi:endonuclease YncB( thermonuclease family)